MTWRFALTALCSVFALAPSAGSAANLTECAIMLEDDAARLACYDRIAMAELKRLVATGEGVPAATATPAAPVAAKPAPKAYKRVDVTDVMATPDKWVDRDIEFASANVYWVADNDLRILTSINMTLFSKAATGTEAELAYLKENCETAKEAQSAKCRVRVRFAYNRHAEDKPNGFSKRTVLAAPTVELVRLQSGRRR